MLTKETALFIMIAIIISIVFSDQRNVKSVIPYLKSPIVNVVVIAFILLIGFMHIGYGILFAITYLFVYYQDMDIKRNTIINEGFESSLVSTHAPSPSPSPSSFSTSNLGYKDLLENRLKKETNNVKRASQRAENDDSDTEGFESSNTELITPAQKTSISPAASSIEFQTLNLKILTNETNINNNTKEIKTIDDRVKKIEDQVKANTDDIVKVQKAMGNPSEADVQKVDKGANEVKNVNLDNMIPS